MKKNVLLILLFVSAYCQAQTKKIAHKSHSGSKHSFLKAYKNNLFDIKHSNFGGPGVSKMRLLDTMLIVNDSTAIFKTRESNVCYRFGTRYTDLKKTDYKSKVDTFTNHELIFYRDNSDRKTLIRSFKLPYYPNNPLEEIMIIDFRD